MVHGNGSKVTNEWLVTLDSIARYESVDILYPLSLCVSSEMLAFLRSVLTFGEHPNSP